MRMLDISVQGGGPGEEQAGLQTGGRLLQADQPGHQVGHHLPGQERGGGGHHTDQPQAP